MADLVPPATLSGTARPLLAEDIGIAALPTAPYESSLRSLCKPAFSEFESGLFMCGTEDQTNPGGNQLIVGSINFETKRTLHTEEGKPCIWTQAVPDHVRDVSWVVPSHAVAAFGSRLALIRVLGPVTERPKFDIIQFPVQHTDLVRELAPCPQAKFTVASCGFDGKVFVTDLVKVRHSSSDGSVEYKCLVHDVLRRPPVLKAVQLSKWVCMIVASQAAVFPGGRMTPMLSQPPPITVHAMFSTFGQR
jgi:hypothetical protein